MNSHQTHLCLVSAQATPSLLPLLDARSRPQRVVLATSPKMQPAADALQGVIRTKCAGMQIERLPLTDAYDFGALSDAFFSYLDRHDGEDIALNVTGGTKPMAIAAQEAFRSAGKPVFYVNIETDEAIYIDRDARPEPLQAQLKVHEMLTAHGHQVTETAGPPQITREQRDLADRLVSHVASSGAALGLFNALTHKAHNQNLVVTLEPQQAAPGKLAEIIGLFEEAGQLRQVGNKLTFTDENARFFANGGWLEFHMLRTLQDLRPRYLSLSDVAMGLRIAFPKARGRSADKNELDVAFLYRNTLHIIECKSANLAQPGATGDDKATEALYKLESLLKLGGLRTRGMIVDYRGALSRKPENLQRASDAGIEIVSGTALRDLKGVLQRVWLTAKKI